LQTHAAPWDSWSIKPTENWQLHKVPQLQKSRAIQRYLETKGAKIQIQKQHMPGKVTVVPVKSCRCDMPSRSFEEWRVFEILGIESLTLRKDSVNLVNEE